MPSNTPAATVVDPKNAALFAVRCLNLPHLREQLMNEINQMKKELIDADRQLRDR